MRARASTSVLCGLLLLAGTACGGGDDGEELAIYHLETAIGPPGEEGGLRCGPPRVTCPGVVEQPAPREVRYEVLGPPAVDHEGIDPSSATAVGASVSVAFTPAGREAFALLTREVSRYGARDQGWHHLALVVGDEIVAFPEVDFDAYPDGIPAAPGVQCPAAGEADARALVRGLRGG